MLSFPYGKSDFYQIRKSGQFYVDRIGMIPTLEEEAGSRLQKYRTDLAAHYSDRLRLRAFAVVALGFERLVWQEVSGAVSQ